MELFKTYVPSFTIIALLFAGFLYIFLVSNSSPSASILLPKSSFSTGSKLHETEDRVSHEAAASTPDDLDIALRRASMKNQTVIIAVVNRAYADPWTSSDVPVDQTMLDLFLQSFWLGEGTRELVENVLIVAMDQTAYAMCKFKRLNCYKLVTKGVDFSGEKLFMSGDFLEMMWSRTAFLTEVLRRGYSFVFTDTDVMWLRNPFLRLSNNETEDLQISTDWFNGDPWSIGNFINTGFYFVRANNRTVSMFETWYSMKNKSVGVKEQDVLLNMTQTGFLRDRLGLKVRFLDTLYFSGFCTDSTDFGSVTTVHANCCRSIEAKVSDLVNVLRDWKRYRKNDRNDRNGTDASPRRRWSKHVGCLKSWGIPVKNIDTDGPLGLVLQKYASTIH